MLTSYMPTADIIGAYGSDKKGYAHERDSLLRGPQWNGGRGAEVAA